MASKPHWCVWGAPAVSGPPWAPSSRRVCFPRLHCSGSSLLCRELSKAGPGLRALPRSKPLRFRFSGISTEAQTRLGLRFVPFPGPSSSGTGAWRAPSPRVQCISPPPLPPLGFPGAQRERRLRCACLLWEADLWLRPSRRMPTVQDPNRLG